MRNLTIILLLFLTSCVTPSEVQTNADRTVFNAVIEAEVTRSEGNLQVGWLDYIEADERLTQEERDRFSRTVQLWRLRIEAAEEALQDEQR